MVTPGGRVVVAVSGGADSVGLLAILAEVQRRLDVELIAAHVHHGLRGAEADADEACAAAAAERLGISFVRRAVGKDLRGGGNIEEHCENLRRHLIRRYPLSQA